MKSNSTITWLTMTPIKLTMPKKAMKPNGAAITRSDTSAPATPNGIAANTTTGLTADLNCTTSARKIAKIDSPSTTTSCPKPLVCSSFSPPMTIS